jgi:hypothetical protein
MDFKEVYTPPFQWVIDAITEEKEEAPSCVVFMNPTAD